MKTTEEIYEQLLSAFTQRYGSAMQDSCDLAVRLYAAAAELQALSIQADWVLQQSFPQTAGGIYLDYHASLRGLERMPAEKAKGTLRFSVDSAPVSNLTVEAGAVCMTADGERFITTEAAVLREGELWTDAPAEAVTAGRGGNVAPDTVIIMAAMPVGITHCTNPKAFSGGCDDEEDASLRERLLESYLRLPNGANAAFYEQVAMSHAGVAAAEVVGRARGIGTVDVYIAGPGGVLDEELIKQVQEDLSQKREIAVDVQVLAPQTKTVDVRAEIAVEEDADPGAVQAAVEQEIRAYFSGKLLGKPVLLAELGNRIYDVEGVENYHLLAPTEDLTGEQSALPVLGELSVTQMEGL